MIGWGLKIVLFDFEFPIPPLYAQNQILSFPTLFYSVSQALIEIPWRNSM